MFLNLHHFASLPVRYHSPLYSSCIQFIYTCTCNLKLAGITLYYSLAQLLLWWLWHTIAVFWAIIRPFHVKRLNSWKMNRYLHLALFLVALILPVAPVLIIMFAASQKGGFTMTRTPPILCAGYDLHTNFWAFIFPTSLVLAVGVTLMVFILRIVIKVVKLIAFILSTCFNLSHYPLESLFLKNSQNSAPFELDGGN